MKATARRVLSLWKRQPAWRGALEDVRAALRLGVRQTHGLEASLAQLVREGHLALQHDQYRLAGAAAASAPQTARPPTAQPPAAPAEPALEGLLQAHARGFGFVDLPGRESLFIPPGQAGGALDGDWVRVQQVPGRGGHRTAGRVVQVLERRRRRARGRIERSHGETWVAPLNGRVPDVFIPRAADLRDLPQGALVDVEVDGFPRNDDEYPSGRMVGPVGGGDAPDDILDDILANSSFPLGFSVQTMAEMAALPGGEPAAQAGREDLTALCLVTIDPEDARDFDDAVGADELPGGWRLWVAIADVASFVLPGSAVDRDAYARGTSVYFPTRVLPMLPERLSNDLCSLRPGVPRRAIVAELELDRAGQPLRERFHEATIRSSARLSYDQVQRFFESGAGLPPDLDGGPVPPLLLRLRELARLLREKRLRRGAVEFEFPEPRFQLDARGLPVRLYKKYPTEATRLVEQCMLEANETVARHCHERGLPILYRVHDPPPAGGLPALAAQLWNAGARVRAEQLATPQGVNTARLALREHPLREQLELQILKAMSQAQYRERNEGHFALAAPDYTHFTSPIRRYPDLIAHRAVKASLRAGAQAKPRMEAPPALAGAQMSAWERLAGDLEQQVDNLYRVLFLEPRLGEDFAATVMGMSAKGLSLALRDEFVECFLPLEALTDDTYRFDAERNLLSGRRRRRAVKAGARLVVQLARADRHAQRLEFVFRHWDWESKER